MLKSLLYKHNTATIKVADEVSTSEASTRLRREQEDTPTVRSWVDSLKNIPSLIKSSFFVPLLLLLAITTTYYEFFLFGKIPFPGDLLITSYAPWFSYFKFPVQNPLISDIFSQFFLWKYLAIDSIKNLQWPLWNPYSFSGTPLLATYHSAALYPLNLLLLLPQYYGWGIFIFSQTLLAAFNIYLLLSRWLDAKSARFLGAIIFAYGGLMATWTEFGTGVHAIAWLPLSILLIELYLSSSKLRYLLGLIISLTLAILAGNAQITTYTFAIAAAFAILRCWDKDIKKMFLKAYPIFISFLFAIALSAPQLLPSFELLQKSVRLHDSYTKDYNFGLLPIREIFKLFSSDFFGNPVKLNYWGFLNYSETSSFMGSMAIPLIIFSLVFLKKNRLVIFFLFLMATSLLLSFQNPISRFIYQINIPLLTSSYASRALFITSFSVSILIAFALNQILSVKNQEEKAFKSVLWSWALYIGITLGAVLVHQITTTIISQAPSPFYRNFYLSEEEFSLKNYITALRNNVLPLFSITSLLLTLIFLKIIKRFSLFSNQNTSPPPAGEDGRFKEELARRDTPRFTPAYGEGKLYLLRGISLKKYKINHYSLQIFSTILIGLSLFELNYYFLKFNPFVPQKFVFPKTPALEYLQKEKGIFRVGREHAEVFPPNTWIAYGIQSIEGYDPLYLNEYGKFMHFLNNGDLRTGGTGRYAELSAKYSSPFIDAANVKYFVAVLRDQNGYIPGDLVNFKFKEAGYETTFKDHTTAILKNPKALERAYFVPSYTLGTAKDIENLIMDDKSFDPKITAALSDNLGLNTVTGKGSVEITSYTPNEVKLTTKTDHEELLILADQYDEGWKAKIDNQETKISRANLIFRAIRVPSGNHNITFYYWPSSFALGLKISFITILVIIFTLIISSRRKLV